MPTDTSKLSLASLAEDGSKETHTSTKPKKSSISEHVQDSLINKICEGQFFELAQLLPANKDFIVKVEKFHYVETDDGNEAKLVREVPAKEDLSYLIRLGLGTLSLIFFVPIRIFPI